MVHKSIMGIMAMAVLFLLAGCSAPVRMQTPQEWLANTSHRFPDKTAEEVLLAGKEVLSLAGAKDFSFAQPSKRMVASRRWSKNLGFAAGFDRWNFVLTAAPEEGGTAATLTIVGGSQPIALMSTETPDRGPANGVTMPSASENGWPYAPAYDLFWRRMEAVLYGSEWVSCGWYIAAPAGYDVHSVSVDPLCFNSKDNAPPDAVLSQAEQNYRGSAGAGGTVAVQQGPVE